MLHFYIEDKLEKNQILELYLNTSYFGDGYDTVKEASKGYFNKEPINLNDSEATMLAGIQMHLQYMHQRKT